MLTILILTAITLAISIVIYVADRLTPREGKGIETTGEAASLLPGTDCDACDTTGCADHARVLANNTDEIIKTKCTVSLQDARIKSLQGSPPSAVLTLRNK
jgi:Na+-translocating ferredoxin:NAD+ oxidoreductase RNF subunit RnfB